MSELKSKAPPPVISVRNVQSTKSSLESLVKIFDFQKNGSTHCGRKFWSIYTSLSSLENYEVFVLNKRDFLIVTEETLEIRI